MHIYKLFFGLIILIFLNLFLNGLDKNGYNKIYDEVVTSKDWGRGVKIFREAVEKYPDEISFHLALNWFLRENKEFNEAYKRIEPLYQKYSDNKDVLSHYKWTLQSLGWEKFDKKDYKNSFLLFEKAYLIDPKDEWIINGYGSLLRETGKIEEAIDILCKGTKTFPENRYIHGNYISALLALAWKNNETNKNGALDIFKKAYDFDKENIWTINGYGYILRETNNFEESINILEKGLTNNKESSELKEQLLYSYLNYANMFKDNSQFDKAQIYYEKSRLINENNELYLLNYGDFLNKKGLYPEAINIFQKGKKLYPQNVYYDSNIIGCYYNYSKKLASDEKYKEAIAILKESSKQYVNEFYFLSLLANYSIKLKKIDDAALFVIKMADIIRNKNSDNQERYGYEIEIFHRTNEVVSKYCNDKKFQEAFLLFDKIETAFNKRYLFLQAKGVLTYHSGNEKLGLDTVYQAYDFYIKDHPQYTKPLICGFPLKGIYKVGGNSRRDAITHAGMNRYCYDFSGCDENGKTTKKEINGFGENEDYFGFGDTIYSPVDGVVDSYEDSMEDLKPTSFYRLVDGNYVTIKGDDGFYYVLVHNKKNSIKVKIGDRVKKGDPIAQLGNSGMTTAPHLHFGVYTPDWLCSIPLSFEEYELLSSNKSTINKIKDIPLDNEIIKAK